MTGAVGPSSSTCSQDARGTDTDTDTDGDTDTDTATDTGPTYC